MSLYSTLSSYYRRDRPKNIFEGLVQGGVSVLGGVAEAVSGPVTQPVTGAMKSGMTGFFSGMVKGIVGVPVKAVGGVLDGVSQVTDGLAGNFNNQTLAPSPVKHTLLFSSDASLQPPG